LVGSLLRSANSQDVASCGGPVGAPRFGPLPSRPPIIH
jgi:hypothetical protein